MTLTIYHVTITSTLTHTQSHSHNQNHVKGSPIGYPITFSHHHRCSPYPPPSPTHQTPTLPIDTSKKKCGFRTFFPPSTSIYISLSLINFAVHIPAPLGSSTGFLSEREKKRRYVGVYTSIQREKERDLCASTKPLPHYLPCARERSRRKTEKAVSCQ